MKDFVVVQLMMPHTTTQWSLSACLSSRGSNCINYLYNIPLWAFDVSQVASIMVAGSWRIALILFVSTRRIKSGTSHWYSLLSNGYSRCDNSCIQKTLYKRGFSAINWAVFPGGIDWSLQYRFQLLELDLKYHTNRENSIDVLKLSHHRTWLPRCQRRQ